MRLATRVRGFRDLTLSSTLLLAATCLVGCRGDGDSHVRVHYPSVEGAPNIDRVRVLWGGERLATETLRPGDSFEGNMHPFNDGSGAITVLVWVDGKQEAWDGHIDLGPSGKEPYSYEVALELGPTGQVDMKTCRTPCNLRGGKE